MTAKVFVLYHDIVYVSATHVARRGRYVSVNDSVITWPLSSVQDIELMSSGNGLARLTVHLDHPNSNKRELYLPGAAPDCTALYTALTGITLIPDEVLTLADDAARQSAIAAFLAEATS